MAEMITEVAINALIIMVISILYKNDKVKKYKDVFFEVYVYKFNIGLKLIISIADFILTVFLILQLREINMPQIIYKLCYTTLIIQLAIFFLAIFFLAIFWRKNKLKEE